MHSLLKLLKVVTQASYQGSSFPSLHTSSGHLALKIQILKYPLTPNWHYLGEGMRGIMQSKKKNKNSGGVHELVIPTRS